MGAVDISIVSMLFFSSILIFPLITIIYLKLGISKTLLYSLSRMIIQLTLVGVYLVYLFEYNNPFLNTLYLLIMIGVASFSITKSSGLNIVRLIVPIFFSILLPQAIVLLSFNFTTVGINELFNAKYLVPIGGMLLGNCLSGNIITLSSFYSNIHKEQKQFFYTLSLGANRYEAIAPFLKESILASINPALGRMATMGIVSLPGMMTGQILGGSIPLVAIKYQILIMIAIFTASFFSGILSIFFTIPIAFSPYGTLQHDIIFIQKKGNNND